MTDSTAATICEPGRWCIRARGFIGMPRSELYFVSASDEPQMRQVPTMYDIYSNARNDSWRFTLGKSGSRKLFTIGLNPSTATREKSDTTVAKVESVAKRNGFDGFVMLNLYPIRSTDFNALSSDVDVEAFSENLNRIETIVASDPKPVVWAAWGENIRARDYFVAATRELFARLQRHGTSWQHFGSLTSSGHPRHPSRLQYAWSFSQFDAKRYVQMLDT